MLPELFRQLIDKIYTFLKICKLNENFTIDKNKTVFPADQNINKTCVILIYGCDKQRIKWE